MPRVSVVMGAFNAQRYLDVAIASVLNQTFKDFEFLIVDDGSSDETAKILRRWARKDKRVKIITHKHNTGLIDSLNDGIKAAKGEFIARMDADDISLPERFRKQVAFFDTHPDITLVGTWATVIDEQGRACGRIAHVVQPEKIRSLMVLEQQFVHPTVMFRRSVALSEGLYDPDFTAAEDYEFFSRILQQHQGANLPEQLLQYRRIAGQGISFTSAKLQQRNALRSRWRMLTRLGWPAWHAVYLVKPLVSYVTPMWLKRYVYAYRMRQSSAV